MLIFCRAEKRNFAAGDGAGDRYPHHQRGASGGALRYCGGQGGGDTVCRKEVMDTGNGDVSGAMDSAVVGCRAGGKKALRERNSHEWISMSANTHKQIR